MSAYYNEHDPFAAAWLREVIKAGHIAPGDVDERDIQDVHASDVKGYAQCHFFAGIGGWSYALRLAGWPDERPVWTGSCPCQPFSCAGKRRGVDDTRHLWPEFFRLIQGARPGVLFGEQVGGPLGQQWNLGVYADLETQAYRVPKDEDGRYLLFDLPAAGVRAPQRRQRLWWVGSLDHATGSRRDEEGQRAEAVREGWERVLGKGCGSRAVGNPAQCSNGARNGQCRQGPESQEPHRGSGLSGRLEHAAGNKRAQQQLEPRQRHRAQPQDAAELEGSVIALGDTQRNGLRTSRRATTDQPHESSFWSLYDLLPCLDGKARRVEPGSFPLAHGVPARVGRLRGYGNAICPWVAKEFIEAYDETLNLEP